MFVSKCLSDREYESAMEAATTARQEAVATIAERETYELGLTNLSAYLPYISWEEAPKKPPKQRYQRGRNQQRPHDIPPNPKLVTGLYERAIAEAASQRAEALRHGDATADAVVTAEAWLVSFWDGLTAFLREHGNRNKELEIQILERAVRSVPSSGTLWASRIRALDFFSTDDDEAPEDISTIANYALESGVLDAQAITSVALAAAAYESHQLGKEEPDVSAFERLRAILESAIGNSREKGGDESLKLEKFLVHARARPDNEAPLKRDRENATVFVTGLWEGLGDDELKRLFKDCGTVREVKITKLPNDVVATVEFMDRESVPAALTKDKKRIQGNEVSVFLAWRSTLYVTNFPEKTDDTFIRDLFSTYGTIFDVRWPSKKFKATRRFCYLQYISPDSAQAALELNGRELEPGMPMNVYISNPQRKKERTDANVEQREVYIAGLAKSTTQKELEELFGESAAKLLLETNGVPFQGVKLELVEESQVKPPGAGPAASKAPARATGSRSAAPAAFVPRAAAVPKPKARLGIGAAKANAAKPPPQQASSSGAQSQGEATAGSSSGGKTQDAFRAMLSGGKK
ncbi:Splicing factor [Tulasnella sp. 408]|nr:Splicing factor [Tulasnella sp. 408]